MKIAILAALLAALTLPIQASAQVAAPPGVQAPARGGSGAHAYHRWMKRLSGIGLSGQQQQQVQNILGQYAAQHPAGSPRDPQGAHALRDQIYSLLNPQQQSQLQAEIKAMRAQHLARRAQMQSAQPPI